MPGQVEDVLANVLHQRTEGVLERGWDDGEIILIQAELGAVPVTGNPEQAGQDEQIQDEGVPVFYIHLPGGVLMENSIRLRILPCRGNSMFTLKGLRRLEK
jgi:hypothetical protein